MENELRRHYKGIFWLLKFCFAFLPSESDSFNFGTFFSFLRKKKILYAWLTGNMRFDNKWGWQLGRMESIYFYSFKNWIS